MTFLDFLLKFPTPEAIIDHFVQVRYGEEQPHCSSCGSTQQITQCKNRPKFFQCNACNHSFSVFKDTIFEKSRTDLRKWFYAIHLFLNSKKGISGYQLQREIGVTYKCAWRMLKQIRTAMGNIENDPFTNTIVEIDETYLGGKPRKTNERKKKSDDDDSDTPSAGNKRGRGTAKTPVVGVLDRENKNVKAYVAHPDRWGFKLTGRQLLKLVQQSAMTSNTIITDEFRSYNLLKENNFNHSVINHSKRYADGELHTNNIESFWSVMKRGILGIYHHVSDQHMQSYVNEFSFRYNHRDNENVFDTLLEQCVFQKA